MAHIPWRRQLRLRAFGSPDLSSMRRKYRRIPSDQTNAPKMRAPRLRSLPGKANCPESAGRGNDVIRRQGSPDPLQLELTDRLDLQGVLDLRQHPWTHQDFAPASLRRVKFDADLMQIMAYRRSLYADDGISTRPTAERITLKALSYRDRETPFCETPNGSCNAGI